MPIQEVTLEYKRRFIEEAINELKRTDYSLSTQIIVAKKVGDVETVEKLKKDLAKNLQYQQAFEDELGKLTQE
jgi:hypothetical protein